mgnify:CR=1 FL=1
MGTLNKRAYEKLIQEDIEELEKYMPEHSLEKKHIIDVLKWSSQTLYHDDGIIVSKLNANRENKCIVFGCNNLVSDDFSICGKCEKMK